MISKILISIPPIFKQFWPSSRKVFLQFLVTEPALETVGIVRWPVAGVSCSCNCTFSAHVHTRIVIHAQVQVYTRTVFPVMPVTFRSNACPRCCVCASHTHGKPRLLVAIFFVTIFFFVQHREINSKLQNVSQIVSRSL